jgi:hypothetical protein
MGATRNCEGCRYWSERLAFADGGPVLAMCLCKTGPKRGAYTTGRATCQEWKSGHLGAVDDPCEPGDETWRMYDKEDATAGNPDPVCADCGADLDPHGGKP